jgi:hypothetical protein
VEALTSSAVADEIKQLIPIRRLTELFPDSRISYGVPTLLARADEVIE